jgi:hypothetical protein
MSKYRALFGVFVVFSALSLAVSPAGAGQGRGQGPAKKAEKAEDKREKVEDKREKAEDKRERAEDKRENKDDRDNRVVVVDRDGHVRAIRDYTRAGSLPPGLAKREALPPGLRRQLRENGALPPGLQKRLMAVPAPLGARFPAIPPHYQRYFVGDDLIVVDTRTNRVVKIIQDVWR